MLLVTKQKFKIALKKILHAHFIQLKSTLVNCELRTVSQDFNIVVYWFKFSVYVHYVSTLKFFKLCLFTLCISLTVYSELIVFPCINFIYYLYTIFTNYYHMYLTVKTHFVLCLLISNNKFYNHSDGSLAYWINK